MITEFINLNDLYDENRVITNPEPLTKEKKFSDDGLFSEKLFGKYNNESETLSYQCECGKFKGKFLIGLECDDCHTEVQLRESSLSKLAWINLDKFYIINPIFYFLLSKLTSGVKKLNNIISYDKKLNKDGEILETENPYDNIGLVEFKERFFDEDGVLNYLYNESKYKDKDDIYGLIIKHKDKIFINHIPVFDTMLRPASITYSDKPVFRFDEINNNYNYIIKQSNMINKENQKFQLVILPNLYNIQCKMNIIFNKIIENLAGKNGFIRSSLLGSRLNFSSRSVITPLPPGYDITEISVPYMSFIELYRFQLINMLSKLKKISMIEAQKIIFDAQTKFNKEIYDLCMELVNKTKYGLLVILIRNPSIARGSVLCQRIAKVKEDITDLTISVHNSILALLAGD